MFYTVGDYEFDTDRRELCLSGTPLRLEPKVCDLLMYLIQHRNQVVLREELYAQLWPEQYVSEAALSYCITEARKAVGDNGRAQRIIKTVHSRGYSFIAPVEERGQGSVPGGTAVLPKPSVSVDAPTAERRQITVLWCHFVLSPAPSETLDQEDLYHVMQQVQEFCAAVMQRFDGRMAQHLSDGLVVYFGHPLAHEDDARRAVYAGLNLIQEGEMLAQELKKQGRLSFTVSIGIHTGVVVLRVLDTHTPLQSLALGDTPRVAAQLANLAAANTVVMSPASFRLVEGYVVVHPLGCHILDDPAESLAVYQAIREHASQNRLDAARGHGFTPFVGRQQEVELLHERWVQSQEDMGQIVIISGEPGIGKSRLVDVFRESSGEMVSFECRCSPYTQHSALYPLIDLVQRCLAWPPEASPQHKLQTLEEMLRTAGLSLTTAVPLLAPLLSLVLPSRYPALTLEPALQKQYTFETLLAWVLHHTERQPLCLVVEDLHWVDPSTMEFLTLLASQMPMARMLVLVTCRSEFVPPWTGSSYVTHMTLSRLTQTQAEQMMTRVTDGKALPLEVRQQLLEKTNGVPLFVEEMTKMVVESGLVKEKGNEYALVGSLPTFTIPATLQDLLMDRLDRQGEGKLVAQLGATLGGEFPYGVLAAISPLDEATLHDGLARLVNAEILYQRGLPPQAHYLFKHALIQDTAYQSLLRQTRQHYHAQIAHVLEDRFPEIVETQPELVAHHCTEAGLHSQATTYWHRAGQRASARAAHMEAIAHLRRGLAVVEKLPVTSERLQHELVLCLALGVAYIATEGYAAPSVKQSYERARECGRQLGDTEQLFTILRGLWMCSLVRGELHTAYELSKELLQLAQRQRDTKLVVEAHRALGSSLLVRGDHMAAWSHLTKAMEVYDPQLHRTLAQNYGQDTGVMSLVYVAWSLWLRGYPDQALQKIRMALHLAQQLKHTFSLVCALFFAALLHQCRRESDAVQEQVERSMTLARQYKFPVYISMAEMFQGWVLVQRGQGEAGIAQIYQGLTAYRATGAEMGLPYMLALLTAAYLHEGKLTDSLATIVEALDLVDRHGEYWWEAELHRLQAVCLWRHSSPDVAEVERLLHHAIAIAHRQHAKSLELRAALDLSRCWQRQGKGRQARDMLANVYQWFQEGFETPDLQEARALLATLS